METAVLVAVPSRGQPSAEPAALDVSTGVGADTRCSRCRGRSRDRSVSRGRSRGADLAAALGADLAVAPGVGLAVAPEEDPVAILEEDPVAIQEEDPVATPEVGLQDHRITWIMDVTRKSIMIAASKRRKEEQEKNQGSDADTIQGVTPEDDLGVIPETTAVENVEATRDMSWSYDIINRKDMGCVQRTSSCARRLQVPHGCVRGEGQLAGRCTLGTDNHLSSRGEIGVYTLALYVHYFTAGCLKSHTRRYTVKLGHLRELIDNPNVPDFMRFVPLRRWLPEGEAPYPGYCRAPGSGVCLPTLCNCDKLKYRWNMMKSQKKLASTVHPL
ncbi:hypothetical protein HW555_000060 [Spodoptera exigua]|uniref:Uncharacterized protein n=1 Tax=Spodoptera exigua TaxID=7107 RepID=A0A835GSZ4_SPOEX|nr:hypothetical protein HW555_000060 [Spodoptera exigua]